MVNKEEVDKKNEEVDEDEVEAVVNSVEEEERERRRKRREATDANGNRVLHVYRFSSKTRRFRSLSLFSQTSQKRRRD